MNLSNLTAAMIDELESAVRVAYARLAVGSDPRRSLTYVYSSSVHMQSQVSLGNCLNSVVEAVPCGLSMADVVITRYSVDSIECSMASRLALRWNEAAFTERLFKAELV